MKVEPFGAIDVFRTITLLILAIFVGVFVAPVAPWVLTLAVSVFVIILMLEIIKYFLRKKKLCD